MIVPMKKATVLTVSNEREQTLEALRELGVLHLEEQQVQSADLSALQERRSRLERAHLILEQVEEDAEGAGPETAGNAAVVGMKADALAAEVFEIGERKQQIREDYDKTQREMDRIRMWGDFKPNDIRDLRSQGVDLRLYALSRAEMDRLPEEAQSFVVARAKGMTCVAVIPENDQMEDFAEFPLPDRSLGGLAEALRSYEADLRDLDVRLRKLALSQGVLAAAVSGIDDEIACERARLSFSDSERVTYLTGYVPEDNQSTLQQAAKQRGWGLVLRTPDSDDPVPTLVRNPKPVRIISPVFKMLGTVPGYHEYDISFLFLLFFTVFFAMIIGDAGYGFVFLGVSVAAIIRTRAKDRAVGRELALLTVLSIGTIVWGAVTGTWFGSEDIASMFPFNRLIVPSMATFNPASAENIKSICFILGAVQILLAHGWNFLAAVRQKPRIRAVAELGWVATVAGLYFLVLNLVLDPTAHPLPDAAIYMIAGGLGAVILFGEQEGSFFRGVGRGFAGLLTTFLDGIGAFADIISYIRLFAVGLATVEIARSFNQMATDMGVGVVGIIGAVAILALGHALNIAMGALSVIVHGVRLNMLEFSGHLGMEWTGRPYAPFSANREDAQ